MSLTVPVEFFPPGPFRSASCGLFGLDVLGQFLYELGLGKEFTGNDSEYSIQGNGDEYAENPAYLSCKKDYQEYFQGMGLYAVGVYEWLEYVVVNELCKDEYCEYYNEEQQQRHFHGIVDMEYEGHHYGQEVTYERTEVGDDVQDS